MSCENLRFGTEKLERLQTVLLHNPLEALATINKTNYEYHLFNTVPQVDEYFKEHELYSKLLKAHGVEVKELRNHIDYTRHLLPQLPNLTYLHDIAVITSKGALLSKMCPGTRAGEEVVVKEVLSNLGIPIYHEFENHEQFEGCLILSPSTLVIVNTQRHNSSTIERFFSIALCHFQEVIYVDAPKARRFMHADMIFNRISEDLGLYYPPAFLRTYLITAHRRIEIDIKSYLESKNFELIPITDAEQQNFGCSFVPLQPKVIFHYDIALSNSTKKTLKNHGVDIIEFHPEALLAGGGSLRCLTLRLWRND
jgi:arginine deiminase